MSAVQERVFLIDPDATVTGLYTDDLDLRAVGDLSTRRASNVEFNSETSLWDVILPDGTIIASDRSREVAIELEIAYLNERMWETGELPT